MNVWVPPTHKVPFNFVIRWKVRQTPDRAILFIGQIISTAIKNWLREFRQLKQQSTVGIRVQTHYAPEADVWIP